MSRVSDTQAKRPRGLKARQVEDVENSASRTPGVSSVPRQHPATRPYRIVVLDDQKGVRDLLTEMLRPDGYDLAVAEGLDELRMLLSNMPTPDLILMDLHLEKGPLEGIQAIRHFKETFNVSATPNFIVISGYGDVEILDELLRIDNVRDFIPKEDINGAEVRIRVRRALRDIETSREAALDPLLRIPNRGMLEQCITEGLAQWARYLRKSRQGEDHWHTECWDMSFVLMDIDDFSKFNNQYGHRAGDEVLVRSAGGMASRLRAGDFIARYGGEELAIIMPLTGFPQARQVIDRIAWEVSREPYSPSRGVDEIVTFSAGIATLTFELYDSREFLHALQLDGPRGGRHEEAEALWKLKEHVVNAADWALREVKDLKNLSGGRRTGHSFPFNSLDAYVPPMQGKGKVRCVFDAPR